jgi:hypothetical protein
MANANAKISAKKSGQSDREESLPPQATNPVGSAKGSDDGQEPGQVRDEVNALQRALPELVSFERYERRAMSRRKRAIRMFEAISTLASFSLSNKGASQNAETPLHRARPEGEERATSAIANIPSKKEQQAVNKPVDIPSIFLSE